MSTAERHLWSRVRGHGGIVLLLLIYLTLAVAYSLASPLYEPTDELRHFRYVRHIVAYHELPVQRADAPRAQSHHPPLYYGLSALASSWVSVEHDVYREPPSNPFWGYRDWETGFDNKNQYLHGDDERFPFRGEALAVYVVRALTIFIGAGVVWLTYCIGLEVFRHHPALALSSHPCHASEPAVPRKRYAYSSAEGAAGSVTSRQAFTRASLARVRSNRNVRKPPGRSQRIFMPWP